MIDAALRQEKEQYALLSVWGGTFAVQDRPGKRVPVETHFVVVVDVSGSMCEAWRQWS